MARRDYRYVGFEDEKAITDIMLRALPKVCRARVEREEWIERVFCAVPSIATDVRVQGGESVPLAQKIAEKKETDKVLGWLRLIEQRLCGKVRYLTKAEKEVVNAAYWGEERLTDAEVARQIKKNKRTTSVIRLNARDKMIRACTSVYHPFCLWREYDEIELDKRNGELFSKIME